MCMVGPIPAFWNARTWSNGEEEANRWESLTAAEGAADSCRVHCSSELGFCLWKEKKKS